jgi:uracil-DNA glycosylase family 4
MSPDRRAVESLLAFWTLSGVDTLYAEGPVDRAVTVPSPVGARAREASKEASARPVATQPTAGLPHPAVDEPSRPVRPTVATAAPPTVDLDVVALARSLAAMATDLISLAAAIAAFDGCELKAGARQSVFSRGPEEAPLMVIGEAPGADEDAQGAPFVGRAGQMLDRMLAAAGLAERTFITNTVFWRPPGNRTPTSAEQAVCAPFLERAIALVKPRALLLVGGASAKAMLKKSEGILSLRGRWFEWTSDDGFLEIPALPTLHPAFLLRQPAAKRKSWEDMLILAERLDRPHRPD